MTIVVSQLDRAFYALSDPTRRAIVTQLAKTDATVTELAAPFDMSLPAISKHLKVLEECGLITRSRRAQFRPCHLRPEALSAVVTWIDDIQRVWNERFDKLDGYLHDLQRDPKSKETNQ
jgi:DNA-binding transcriptional ArsR family regulator